MLFKNKIVLVFIRIATHFFCELHWSLPLQGFILNIAKASSHSHSRVHCSIHNRNMSLATAKNYQHINGQKRKKKHNNIRVTAMCIVQWTEFVHSFHINSEKSHRFLSTLAPFAIVDFLLLLFLVFVLKFFVVCLFARSHGTKIEKGGPLCALDERCIKILKINNAHRVKYIEFRAQNCHLTCAKSFLVGACNASQCVGDWSVSFDATWMENSLMALWKKRT